MSKGKVDIEALEISKATKGKIVKGNKIVKK